MTRMSRIFQTDQLYVRKLVDSDLKVFDALQGDPRVMQYTTGRGMNHTENRDDLRRVIDLYDVPGNTYRVWAVVVSGSDEFAGTCALVTNDDGENEIGFRFLPEYWGRGYATEIVGGLARYAFGVLLLDQIVAYVNVENVASVRVMEKSPFECVREFYNVRERCVDRYYVLTSNFNFGEADTSPH